MGSSISASPCLSRRKVGHRGEDLIQRNSVNSKNPTIIMSSGMDDSKLRLQWRDHGNELSRLSRDVFCREDLSDVTLTCRGGTPFSAHKMILAAASTYFRNFFMEVRGKINQHQVIFMKDIDPGEMEYLLQFIYLGEVDIPSLELERLIAISKDLGIIGLDSVKKEDEQGVAGERRTLHATKKRKLQSVTSKTPVEPITPKIAKVEGSLEEDPIYDNDVTATDDQQDPFDEDYMDGNGGRDGEADDSNVEVAESDVQNESVNEDRDNKQEMDDRDAEWIECKKRSVVWKHFLIDKTSRVKVKCKRCLITQDFISGTTNMLRHLQRHHHLEQ